MNTDSADFSVPPKKTVRLACAGLGFIFRNAHADALAHLRSCGWPVEIAMVCDCDQAALDAACQRFPTAKSTHHLEDILDCREEIDALLICLWPPLSLNFLRQAIARGFKKILIEKPVSHHAADIRGVADEARRAGAHVHVAYNRRHQPALGAFTQAVQKLSGLESVSATVLRVDRKEPIFYEDVTPHPLSVFHHLLGDLTVQDVIFGEQKNGIPEFLEATLKNADGVQATLKLRPSSGELLEHYEARSGDQHLQLPFLPSESPHGAGWSSLEAGASIFHGIPDPAGLSESLSKIWRTGYLSQMAEFLREEVSPTACSLEQAANILNTSETISSWHGKVPVYSALP